MQTGITLKNIRKDYSKIQSIISIPHLIDIQQKSYKKFLQLDVEPEKRKNAGLQAIFNSIFPITDFNNTCSLEFIRFDLDKPKYDVAECKIRGTTYGAAMRITVRLVVYDVDEETKAKNVRDIKEQDVYLGESCLKCVRLFKRETIFIAPDGVTCHQCTPTHSDQRSLSVQEQEWIHQLMKTHHLKNIFHIRNLNTGATQKLKPILDRIKGDYGLNVNVRTQSWVS